LRFKHGVAVFEVSISFCSPLDGHVDVGHYDCYYEGREG
jgi:hypothetical protein